MHQFRKLILCTLLSVLAPLASAQTSHLNRANAAEPESLDPQLLHTLPGMRIANDLFDGLVHRNPKGELVAGQARSWSVSEDGLTWTFQLRKSNWSNGKPVTAQDFVYAWQRAANPKTASSYAWYLEMAGIKNASPIIHGKADVTTLGVTAKSSDVLEVSLEQPVPWFLDMLVMPVLYPVPADTVEKYGEKWTQPGNIVTNGTYTLTDWVVNEKISLSANKIHPDYNQLAIQSVSYLSLPSDIAAFNRYRAGDVDITLNIPSEYHKKVKKEHGNEIRLTHMLGTEYYAFNTNKAPLNNPDVRRALSLALDRNLLTNNILGGDPVAAQSFTPPYMAEAPKNLVTLLSTSREEQLREARTLYKKAGYNKEHPLKLTLVYNTSESRRKIAIAAASMWKQYLGAEITLENMEWKSLISRIRAKDFDIARASWVADFNNPVSMLAIFASDSSSNKAGFKNSDYDNLIKSLTMPGTNRDSAYRKLEMILDQEVPVAPLYHYVSAQLVSPKVKGWYDNPRDLVMSRYLSLGHVDN